MRNAETVEKSNEDSINERWITVEQVGQILHVGKRTVWRYDKLKKIPAAKKTLRRKLWDKNDIDLWLELGCPNRKKFDKLKEERTKQ